MHGLDGAFALALLSGRIVELFRQHPLLRGQADIGEFQFVGAKNVAVKDVQEFACQMVRGRDLRQFCIDLLQILLRIMEEPTHGT